MLTRWGVFVARRRLGVLLACVAVVTAAAAYGLGVFGSLSNGGYFVEGSESYDAATVIISALEKVAEKDGDKLKIDLKKLNEEIRKVELDGAAGKVKFDARGDNVGGETPVSLFVVKSGAYEEVKN